MPLSMLANFRRWFDYEKAMHRQVLDSLSTVPEGNRDSEPFQKSINLMSHLIAARRIWLHRIDSSFPRPTAIFPTGASLESLSGDFASMERDWDEYLGRLTDVDLDSVLTYTTMEGDWFRTAIVDILTQLHGHSLYHRGQIASLVRASGGEPAKTDFIFWVREQVPPPAAS